MRGFKNNRTHTIPLLVFFLILTGNTLFASGGEQQGTITSSVGIAILAAMVMGFLSHILKQPLLLAYIAAGVLIGPRIGLGLIASEADIETISHIGLILLLFLIGLEIDIKKLRESGVSLIATGLSQFVLCVAMGLGFFSLLGYAVGDGRYDLLYLAACCAISSTAIVVKLLYGKFELDTLAGRITLGILVFQDIWAIIVLGVQPNLANPNIITILLSFAKGGLLVAISLAASKYILPRVFRSIAKIPELVLVSSLGWCFLVCGAAGYMGLSLEMGALIAGVAISTFPYNLDVIAKVVNIRDFFVTLFFVALGMQIPNPLAEPALLATAAIASLFLIASRFLAIFPVLYFLKNGNRVSMLTSINLSQISEFSLVIAALGFSAGHIGPDILSIVIFIFVITSIVSTYMINYSDAIQKALNPLFQLVGFRDIPRSHDENGGSEGKDIALLGFHRTASSLVREIMDLDPGEDALGLRDKLVVVDFNPEVHSSLHSHGIKAIYGDIGHMDTLHHAGIHDAKVVVSTIPDTILVGTDNLRMIRHIRSLCPHAKIVVTAESAARALKMYAEGADHVILPRVLTARHLLRVIGDMLRNDETRVHAARAEQVEMLKVREEIIR
jgi:Kef-type K+ transport system membrane component KefB